MSNFNLPTATVTPANYTYRVIGDDIYTPTEFMSGSPFGLAVSITKDSINLSALIETPEAAELNQWLRDYKIKTELESFADYKIDIECTTVLEAMYIADSMLSGVNLWSLPKLHTDIK
jgi:hypothetical protein